LAIYACWITTDGANGNATQMVPTVMLLALVSFGGVWRMYQIFIMEFPKLERPLAYTFFFLPSVFFWGSGILKDSITLSALGYQLL